MLILKRNVVNIPLHYSCIPFLFWCPIYNLTPVESCTP